MRLLQVAALAAVMVPLGSVVAEASSITFSPSFTTGTYDFFNFSGGLVTFTLAFNKVFDQFSVDVETTTFATVDQLDRSVPAGDVCVPIAGPGTGQCVDFTATTSPTGVVSPTDFNFYHVTILWTFDTDPNFPNTGDHRVELLESHSTFPFIDITIPGSYSADVTPGDPGISGQSDSFSQYTIVDATVPEPATVALLGSGLTGLLMRYRRRKRQGPDADSRL